MRTKVQMWGNSLALRIPRAFAIEINIERDSLVEVSLIDGQIVIKPVLEEPLSLEALLAGITPENLHEETDTGVSAGIEAW